MMRQAFAALILAGAFVPGAKAAPTVTDIFPQTTVTKTNIGDFMTPIAYYNGALYEVDVEPPSGTMLSDNLVTVIRKGVQNSNGTWSWTSHVLETRTMKDQYHALASIGIDRQGYIHVAFNMHSMPWQYAVSNNPGDISSFTFKGEAITLQQIDATLTGHSSYPDVGTAKIEGQQITYPRFTNDDNGNLYVSYRMALYPALANYDLENFGCGVARYDTSTKTWTQLGGLVPVSSTQGRYSGSSFSYHAVADQQGLWCDRLSLNFDGQNRMGVVWEWYDYTKPGDGSPIVNFLLSPDDGHTFVNAAGSTLSAPVHSTGAAVFTLPQGNEMPVEVLSDANSNPVLKTVTPAHPNAYHLLRLNSSTHSWADLGQTPYNASLIIRNSSNDLYAVASGPILFMAPHTSWGQNWKMFHQEYNGWGYPFAAYSSAISTAFVRLMKCGSSNCTLRIIKIH